MEIIFGRIEIYIRIKGFSTLGNKRVKKQGKLVHLYFLGKNSVTRLRKWKQKKFWKTTTSVGRKRKQERKGKDLAFGVRSGELVLPF